jgi:hypothetical protein
MQEVVDRRATRKFAATVLPQGLAASHSCVVATVVRADLLAEAPAPAASTSTSVSVAAAPHITAAAALHAALRDADDRLYFALCLLNSRLLEWVRQGTCDAVAGDVSLYSY